MNQEHESSRDRRHVDKVDQLLDVSLANYNSAAEPRAGLEDRILANLHTQPVAEASSWFNWRWVFASASAVAAVVLIAVLLMPKTQRQPPPPFTATKINVPRAAETTPTPTLAPTQRPTPNVAASPRSVVVKHPAPAAGENLSAHNQQVAVAAAVPHLDSFPAAAPLSPQERMLFSYVRRTPREVLVAVSEEQQLHEQEWMQGTQSMQPQQRSEQKSENLK